jgi:HAD superfamily hydrolase (TIGR01509 family)
VSSPPRPGILFDLDGTLVDTNYLHTLAWSRAFAAAGEWAPMNAIHRLVGMGGDQLVVRLLGQENKEAQAGRAEQYAPLICEAKLFPGARDVLAHVHETGCAVVLATSSPQEEVAQLRRLLDADQWIDVVTTADDAKQSKPAPDIFEAAIERAGLDKRFVLAVGDSVWDVEAARAAGISCVAVESGGFSRHELAEVGAVHVYEDIAELDRSLFTGPLSSLLLHAGEHPRI